MTLSELQEYIRQKDHHPERKLVYLQRLVEEVGELAKAMRNGMLYHDTQEIKGSIDEELYDALYYVAALANVYGVDLEEAMRLKEPLNLAKYGAPGPKI